MAEIGFACITQLGKIKRAAVAMARLKVHIGSLFVIGYTVTDGVSDGAVCYGIDYAALVLRGGESGTVLNG